MRTTSRMLSRNDNESPEMPRAILNYRDEKLSNSVLLRLFSRTSINGHEMLPTTDSSFTEITFNGPAWSSCASADAGQPLCQT